MVVVHRFSCSAAYGIFPGRGSNVCLLYFQVDSLPLSHQGKPLPELFFFFLMWVIWLVSSPLGHLHPFCHDCVHSLMLLLLSSLSSYGCVFRVSHTASVSKFSLLAIDTIPIDTGFKLQFHQHNILLLCFTFIFVEQFSLWVIHFHVLWFYHWKTESQHHSLLCCLCMNWLQMSCE